MEEFCWRSKKETKDLSLVLTMILIDLNMLPTNVRQERMGFLTPILYLILNISQMGANEAIMQAERTNA